jgi:atypical protein kinase C iota type
MSRSGVVLVKVVFKGKNLQTELDRECSLEDFSQEIRVLCKLEDGQEFTMKWVDEEGDPCTISSQDELEESVRLFDSNRESGITLHVFDTLPPAPGMACDGEDCELQYYTTLYTALPRFLHQCYYLNFYSYVKRNNCG